MSLASSLNVGVSALRAYSEGIQVVSNNIANVNTVGYKASHAQYSDTFSNILKPLVPNENNTAVKIAPTQVGGGVQVEAVSPVFSQGTIQVTNSNSDLAIAGNGFLRVKNPQTGQYDAAATPSTGSQTLFSYYAEVLGGKAAAQLGDHAVF